MSEPRIAILTRAGFLYHLQVGWGFFESIESYFPELNWRPILFFCKEADERVMFEQMEEIRRNNYDLIISVGSMRTAIAHRYIKEHNWDIPLIFCGVTDPVGMGILPELNSQKNITGVMREEPSWLFTAEMLYTLKPGMQKLLIPYHQDAEAGLTHKRLEQVQDFFEKKGVSVTLLPVLKVRDFPEIVRTTLPTIDTLWCIGGAFLENFHKDLAELSNRHGVTFFVNSISAEGASIAFGDDVRKIGKALFEQTFSVIEKKILPKNVPLLTVPNQRKIIIDTQSCKRQNLQIDPLLLFCLNRGIIIN